MPWTVLIGLEQERRRARESSDRTRGACQETIHTLLTQTSAVVRRRGTEDMAVVSALIAGTPHCVPCITLITGLHAQRIYAALERLKADINLQLRSERCTRCARTTMVHVIEP